MTQIPTIAIVVNKYGDPEGFAERDLEVCDDFQKLGIGTNLVDMKHVVELQAKIEALHELAVQANRNCMVATGYLKKHRPALAYISQDWCENIEAEIQKVMNED